MFVELTMEPSNVLKVVGNINLMTMITLSASRKKLGRVLKRAVKIFELCRNHEAQLRELNMQKLGFTLLPADEGFQCQQVESLRAARVS